MGATMGIFHRRRAALAAALSVAATVFGLGPAGPAAADRPECNTINQFYAVTYSGALVQHEDCLTGQAAGHTVRRVTAPGWATGGEIFSGRYIKASNPLTSVVYQVSRSGALLWYSDQGRGTDLGDGVPVGASFGDWRQFRSLFSPGHGRIYGIDRAGRVLHWVHQGFSDGSDVWEGPDVVATGFGSTRRIVGVWPANGLVVGIDRAQPSIVKFWDQDGQEVGGDDPAQITGAAGSGPLTWSGPPIGYGRSRNGRVLVLERTLTEPDRKVVWVASELDTVRYARVLAGGRWQLFDPQPYQWQ